MPTTKKAIELVSQKYHSPIIVLGNNKQGINNCILDTNNGTLFSFSENNSFTFKDKHGNFWLTIPKSFVFNDKHYYPKIGDVFTRTDGIKYFFKTGDEVVNVASAYFEKYIDIYYGFNVQWKLCYFSENEEDRKCHYKLVDQKFKSAMYDKIKAYISIN
ncbi:hypothetical protein AR687_16815 [Flavobacteriaceae bacterium CRH]|nr:hypothetical protein AR687_16815 [Flavobacteriaceae bacterium CRH]